MKKILIIGAGFLQDFVLKKAKDMGYYTLAVDADENAIGFKHCDEYRVVNIVDEKACLEYAREKGIDGVLTAATDYGVLTAAYVAEKMGLPGLDYSAAKLVKNKYLVRKKLFEARVDDTKQAYEVADVKDAAKLCDVLEFPVMVKPCDGSGSRGAARVDGADGLEAALKTAIDASLTHRAEIETFIDGREYGAESLVADGKINVLSVMKKYMTQPPYYAELGHAIPSDLPKEIEEKAKNCVKNAIKALGINFGSVNMDMLITDKGSVHIVDIGARMGGNMIGPCIIPYGTGVDYVGNMIKNAVGDKVDLTPSAHSAVATRLLAFEDDAVAHRLPNFKELESKYGVEIYHHMEQGQKINKYRTNLDGCGYIVAKAEDVDAANDKAQKVLCAVKIL